MPTAVRFNTLQTRLVLAVSLPMLAAVAAVALWARESTRVEFFRFREHTLGAPATGAADAAAVAAALDRRCCAPVALESARGLLGDRDAIVVTDATGRAVTIEGPGVAGLRRTTALWRDGVLTLEGERAEGRTAEGMALQFRGVEPLRITTSTGEPGFVHIVTLPPPGRDPPADAFLGSVDRRLLIATSVIGLLAVAMTWTIARRVARPLGQLGRAARGIARGDLTPRVAVEGPGEVAEVARAFNAMAGELERQQQLRRHLVNDVAHELRTPLTAMRCRLETLMDGLASDPAQALAGIHDELGHLSRLVDDLQELAVAEARELRLSFEAVAVNDAVRSAARAAGLEHDPRLHLAVDPALRVHGDATRLRQVLVNLISNADRHTPASGRIEVRAVRQDDGRVQIEVFNTGSHLAPDEIARVFDRFYRADPARQRATGGTGLGLAIVKHLVEAQGGTVGARSDHQSVVFTLWLPPAPDA